jgi:hypothetical protein
MNIRLRALVALSSLPIVACAADATHDSVVGAGAGAEKVAATSEALSYIPDPGWMYPVSWNPTPANYGTYCSVADQPDDGGWAFEWSPPGGADPCKTLAPIVGPHTVVQRAGLYNENGWNNAMVRCDGGVLYYGMSYGEDAPRNIFNSAVQAHGSNCVIMISPVSVNTWGPPFDTSATVTGTSVFDYDITQQPWNIQDFGMVGGDGNACAVDRTGYEDSTCQRDAKGNLLPGPWWQPNPPGHAAFEPAYDWSMARDTPILAVDDGVIRWSGGRYVGPNCPTSVQEELFLETQVGSGEYAEHVVAAYHHMDPNPSGPVAQSLMQTWGGQPMAPTGTYVKKGEIIGFIGTSGCSGGYHLDFMAFRLTNLTGARSYVFQNVPNGPAGVNGWQGIFDPFGWDAPADVDPLSYKFIGVAPYYNQPASVTDPGTFSMVMWDWWTDVVLPHSGGNRYY